MQTPPSPPPPPQPPQERPIAYQMDDVVPQPVIEGLSNSLFDWSDFLDFNIDDQLSISFDSDHPLEIPLVSEPPPISPIPVSSPDNLERVRKRDPRLTCSNFLAGKIPCSCPEMDAKLEEEEGGSGKKRARTVRVSAATARCQVPGCEADITELKGYHRRHRVCLRCANASTVVLDGQNKRYCQQCGKFHILSDFDEGKRSCRRKLERHNNRRRRKSTDSKGTAELEPQPVLSAEEVGCDDETGKDSICLVSQIEERETLVESEGHILTLDSAHCSQNIQSDSGVSFVASGEAQIDGGKDNAKFTHSPSYCDNRTAFSSACPTGRISFKLYDWNPAEFPRRLRHQIFMWLASMPVELEGYIRPGCVILTMFIAMPKFMWVKFLEDPKGSIHDFVVTPGNMLSGRNSFLIHLNNMIFRVMDDGISVMKVKVGEHTPKLHYIHPTCFEAGKPLEFVACGSNLLQPKSRFLVSFAGKYLACDLCVPPMSGKTADASTGGFTHQLVQLHVPHTEPDVFGPAFIEVENESGISNFIPILIGDQEICSEMKIMQQKLDASVSSEESQFEDTSSSCQVCVSRQRKFSEFTLDIAWLLKKPASRNVQHILTASQIQRFNFLLSFLIQNESIAILERATYYMKLVMDSSLATGIAEADLSLLKKHMGNARDILCQTIQEKGGSKLDSSNLVQKVDCDQSFVKEDMEVTHKCKLDAIVGLTSSDRSGTVPLLNEDFVMSINLVKEQPRKSYSHLFTNPILTSRPLIFVIAAAVCCGLCAVLLHPREVGKLATTIRRCLFDNS
ncbi:unnamed protein product [Ilex paraguariensis]|uniref:SBP-type domain-containing protein n=1 Tax=Ilex paraguariensis TaxID=185542 RepID=A0ABC8SME8_9AQUA